MKNENLKKVKFKTKKELYNILKENECYVIRKLNIEKETVNKFFQYSNDFDKYFDFFRNFALKYTSKDEIDEVKYYTENDENDYIFRLSKRLYQRIKFISENDKIVSVICKSQYLILENKYHLYKNDIIVKNNKLLSKDNIVEYEFYI